MKLRPAILLAALCAAPAGCASSQAPESAPQIGARAPDLSATAHNGELVELRELRRPAIVYFYPKDETPGCTAEACAFRDVWDRYQRSGVAVIGVSADSDESHREFADEHRLPFALVADPQLKWANAFGVETTLGMTHRVSFLLDADGRVAKVYPKVDPGVHAEQILDDVAGLSTR